ncbi:MAG TPA: SpoIID/LytB domain-containing protein [Blastocatellia bacterium]|nr:SpoIID/LytB domain-containing protein [Blastocatellia bacterium]
MKRLMAPARSVVALAVAAVLSSCLQFFALGGSTPVRAAALPRAAGSHDHENEEPRQAGFTRPRRVDEARQGYSEAGPVIRIGLATDVTAISLSSPSGLAVRLPAIDIRDSQRISSGRLRAEIRRLRAAPQDSSAREKSGRAEPSQMKPSRRAQPAISKAGRQSPRKAEAEEDKRVSRVVAFDSDRMVASSETVLIVAPGPEDRARDDYEERSDDSVKNRADRPALVRVGEKDYRGEIHLLLNERGRINVVNVLPLEEYLRGVVPLELSPLAYPQIEALKAQAIAARTYALSHRNRFQREGFDLTSDARSQVYGGMSAEQAMTNRAVDETRGIVAVYRAEDGRESPIEALYTSNCGGRTENNESIFLTRPVPYLRSVECAPDREMAGMKRELVSAISSEPLVSPDGRAIGREVALVQVLGFNLPRQLTNQYLRGSIEQDEAQSWIEYIARMARPERPAPPRASITRLPGFASFLATALYGEGRARLLLTSSDVDYILAGLDEQQLPPETRAGVAMLLRNGIIRLPADGRLNARAPVTRAYAIETIARALLNGLDGSKLKVRKAIARPAENNRLLVASVGQAKPEARPQNSHLSRISSAKESEREASTVSQRSAASKDMLEEFEIEKGAWLFRRLGGESYRMDRLQIIGGERIIYHVNGAGRVDFLEAETSESGAASDRFSSTSRWRERVTLPELKGRLARSRVSVGDIEDLAPVVYGPSNRVLELEVVGSKAQTRLRGHQVRNALGLKENLFVIDKERDEQGRVIAFVFTGKGWGHGVGMCQNGAFGLAKEGYSYSAILQKYYTGVKLQKAY